MTLQSAELSAIGQNAFRSEGATAVSWAFDFIMMHDGGCGTPIGFILDVPDERTFMRLDERQQAPSQVKMPSEILPSPEPRALSATARLTSMLDGKSPETMKGHEQRITADRNRERHFYQHHSNAILIPGVVVNSFS
jgi:hypothetical protein